MTMQNNQNGNPTFPAELTAEMLARMFALSASEAGKGDPEEQERAVRALERGIADGEYPVQGEDPLGEIARWRQAGYPAVHHSGPYREAYAPAYRVVSARYARYAVIMSAESGLIIPAESPRPSAIV